MFYKHIVVLLVIVCASSSKAVIEGSPSNNISNEIKNATGERTGRTLHKECSGSLSAKCMKIHVLSFLEDLNSRNELPILPGLSIIKENQTTNTTPEELAAELSRQFPGKPDEKLNRFILYRLKDYLDGHSIRYRLLDPVTSKKAMDLAKGDSEVSGRGKGGGGGGGGFGGGKGGGGGLLAAAMMMKGEYPLNLILRRIMIFDM